MNGHLTYYASDIPLHGGAYLKPNFTYTYLHGIMNFFELLFNVCIVILIACIIYNVCVFAYEKYKERKFLLEDTNRKVTEIQEYLRLLHVNQSNITDDVKIENEKNNSDETVFVVDENGIITESKEKIEEN